MTASARVEPREGRRPAPGPGEGSLEHLRGLLAFRRNPIARILELHRRFGDVVYLRVPRDEVLLLAHPDHIREVLVEKHHAFTKSRGLEEAKRVLGEGLLTSEGRLHRRQRRMMQPNFHHRRIAGYATTMVERAVAARERWRHGQALDVAEEMMALTLTIVGTTLFDADVEAEAAEIGEAMTVAVAMFDRMTLPYYQVLDRLPLPSNRRFERARRRLDATIYRLIEEHRRSGDRGDLLSMLLAAVDEETGERMSDLQVRDEAMTIFLAGHETTAQALTWTWYLLSRNPAVEARLHAELDEVLGGRPPSIDDLPHLPYLEMVVAESMRRYPPAWIVGRHAAEDVEIAGYRVGAGTTVAMSQYAVHHDPRWWPDPFRFDPGRWTPEVRASRPRLSYFPFGAGPRICIGEGFAWMEAELLVATIAQRWRLRVVPGHPVRMHPRITLRPRYGMRMVPLDRSLA